VRVTPEVTTSRQTLAGVLAREARLGARLTIDDEEIIAADEGDAPAVGRELRGVFIGGRRRQARELRCGHVEEEEIAVEQIQAVPAGGVERLPSASHCVDGTVPIVRPSPKIQSKLGGALAGACAPGAASATLRPRRTVQMLA
jgi:hypothetical protein